MIDQMTDTPGNIPAIDVLLATYNGERFLETQIESILGQRDVNIRIIARDDGSGDSTSEILKMHASLDPDRFMLLPTDGRLGAAVNFSRLLERSGAPYLAFADQDDIWHPDKLRTLLDVVRGMEADLGKNAPLLAHCDLEVIDDRDSLLATSFWRYVGINPRRNRLNHLLGQNTVTGCATLINRPLALLSTPIPPQAVMHDYWIALVAAALGHIRHVSLPLVRYRQHVQNTFGAHGNALIKDIWNTVKYVLDGKWRMDLRELTSQPCALLIRHRERLTSKDASLLQAMCSLADLNWIERCAFLVRNDILRATFLRSVSVLLRIY